MVGDRVLKSVLGSASNAAVQSSWRQLLVAAQRHWPLFQLLTAEHLTIQHPQRHFWYAVMSADERWRRCMQNRVAVLQSLSGTGSLRLGAAFIAKFLPGTTVYVSNPTWGNHNNIFADAGVKVGQRHRVGGSHVAQAKPETVCAPVPDFLVVGKR